MQWLLEHHLPAQKRETLSLALFPLALIAYSLPWLVNPAASLSPGAYDLAEWASLHPASRAATPPLFTSLLLRLPLLIIALIAAFSFGAPFNSRRRWPVALVVLVISGAQLPPAEFYAGAAADANYRQQFILALATLSAGTVGLLTTQWGKLRRAVVLLLAALGLITGVWGTARAYSLMRGFGLPVTLGAGVFMLSAVFAALLLAQLLPLLSLKKQTG